MTHIYTILSIVGTLLFIGFFAGYEIAFVTANRLSIELKKKQGKRKKGDALSLMVDKKPSTSKSKKKDSKKKDKKKKK